uniref:Uncharacterized protein n=1 Tax=Rhizophora mucronata TaxID=61149 RepID=A0A2P2N9J3_RHIMU
MVKSEQYYLLVLAFESAFVESNKGFCMGYCYCFSTCCH